MGKVTDIIKTSDEIHSRWLTDNLPGQPQETSRKLAVERVSDETRSEWEERFDKDFKLAIDDYTKTKVVSADIKDFIRDNFISRKELKEKIEELVSYPASGSRMETEYLISKSEILTLLNKGGKA